MRVNGATKKPLGPWSPIQVRTIADAVNSYNEERRASNVRPTVVPVLIMARITGSNAISGATATVGGVASTPIAWLYDWEETFLNGSGAYQNSKTLRRKSSLSSSTLGRAFNGCEGPQLMGSTLVLGPGITTANIPAGFTIQPIANDTVVLMYALARDNGQQLFFFSCPNAIDGVCAENLLGEE
jgi:hypothetical protein